MEAYILDTNGFLVYKKDINLEEQETLNYTIKQMAAGYYKPRFNRDIDDWEEGATPEEIEQIEQEQEANRPPQEPSKVEVLKEEVIALEKENKLLKAQVEALSQTSDFHEELIVEMANKVYA